MQDLCLLACSCHVLFALLAWRSTVHRSGGLDGCRPNYSRHPEEKPTRVYPDYPLCCTASITDRRGQWQNTTMDEGCYPQDGCQNTYTKIIFLHRHPLENAVQQYGTSSLCVWFSPKYKLAYRLYSTTRESPWTAPPFAVARTLETSSWRGLASITVQHDRSV